MHRFAIAFTALVLLAMLGACGDSDRLSDEEFEREAERIGRDVLLREDDFPSGWSGFAPGVGDEDDFNDDDLEGLSDECRRLIDLLEGTGGDSFPNATVDLDSEDFTDDDENEMSSDVAVFRSTSDADDAWGLLESFQDDCGGDLEGVFQQAFERELLSDPEAASALSNLEFDLGFEDVDDLGERALRLQGEVSFDALGVPFDLDFDITWIQVGRIIVGFESTDLASLDEDLVSSLTELTISRAEEADDELPR